MTLNNICECSPPGINWQLQVHTSNLANADSDAEPFIAIYGENGWTKEISINELPKDDMEIDAHDVHNFTSVDIGRPIKLVVWHKDNRVDPSWHLAEVHSRLARFRPNSVRLAQK